MSWFDKEDELKLKKLKVSSLLDLALLLPSSYEDNFLSNELQPGKVCVIDAEVKSIQRVPKYLKVKFYSFKFDKEIEGIIFHPKPFHSKLFSCGNRVFIKGRVEFNFGKLSIIQPKTITEINTISVKYKTPLKNQTVKKLINKYIDKKTLLQEGLSEKEAESLLLFHYPTHNFLKHKDSYYIYTLKFAEIFNHLKKLSRKKRVYKATSRLNGDIETFIQSLPFTLTNDQLKAIEDIRKDFQSPYASKRVIVGDVGCGKTMVILAAVVMAYPKKALLMAPTSILAHQIFHEAKKFLPSYIKVGLITSKEKNENLEEFDFLVGTHALLYKDLPKCELVMVDEQHRFGVNQREMIKKLAQREKDKRVHFLQFSATPIPRTLAMINSSLVDYSFIKELPFKKEIVTKIISRDDFKNLIKHIENEIKKNHQIAVIYPLVEESDAVSYQSIEEAKSYWQKRYDNVFVTFGKDKEKDEILENFRQNGNILISTTVIEVGISLPRLTTVVIVGAERLGLATLHQIRGRVSRTGLKGYCFLYTNDKNSKRLKEFAKTKSGFDIAELDLKFRQSGDVIEGKLQSGKIFEWIDLSSDTNIIEKAKQRLTYLSLKASPFEVLPHHSSC